MAKKNTKQTDQLAIKDNQRITRIIFLFVIVIFTFLLYGNTLKNRYSLDDYIIQGQSAQLVKEGISSIDEIFSTTYR